MRLLATISFSVITLLLSIPGQSDEGKFINPITDICWKCLFPIHLGGVNVTPGEKDYMNYQVSVCACAGTPPKIGVPLAFWEPVALIDVTRTPYKSIVLGGTSLSSSTVKGRGGLSGPDHGRGHHRSPDVQPGRGEHHDSFRKEAPQDTRRRKKRRTS